MTTKSTSALDKYFEALTESYDAIIEAVKAGNERGYRVSNNLIAEAQKGQKDALELARQMFDELSESRTETREVIEKVIKAQRVAGEAAVEAARDVASTTAERVRTGVERVTTRGAAPAASSNGGSNE